MRTNDLLITMNDPISDNHPPSIPERRQAPRTKIQVKRTILATVEDRSYGSMQNFIYLEDISTNGLRINMDRTVEPESRLHISFPLAAFELDGEERFASECRVVWSKPLTGGTCILGLEFMGVSPQRSEVVQRIIAHWQAREGLNLVQLFSPLDAKLRYRAEEPWSTMIGVKALSLFGLKFPSPRRLELESQLEVRLLLSSGTVQAPVLVKWCQIMPNGVYEVGCEFLELSASSQTFISLHLRG